MSARRGKFDQKVTRCPRAAVYAARLTSLVLTQLTCPPTNATVWPSLAFDNETKSSLLLLVEYGRTQAGKPRIGQLMSPNFQSINQSRFYFFVRYTADNHIKMHTCGRKKRNKKFNMIIFSNFIIQGEHCIVNIITLGELFSFKDIRDLFFLCKRFCRYTSSRVETHNDLTDLNSLLATIAQTGVDREKLQQVYDANFSVILPDILFF